MEQNVLSKSSSRVYWTKDDIRNRIVRSKVLVFAKGSPEKPQNGFSEQAFAAVEDCGKPFDFVDVSEDSSILAALQAYQGRAPLPLIFANGSLVSDSENMSKMLESGELKAKLEKVWS